MSAIDAENSAKSKEEVRLFRESRPERYVLYIDEPKRLATTWMGDKLGDVSFGRPWTDSFGGRRVPVRILGINGLVYAGTYFKSSGDYARVRLLSGQ